MKHELCGSSVGETSKDDHSNRLAPRTGNNKTNMKTSELSNSVNSDKNMGGSKVYASEARKLSPTEDEASKLTSLLSVFKKDENTPKSSRKHSSPQKLFEKEKKTHANLRKMSTLNDR